MSLMRHAITILSCFLICSVEAFIARVRITGTYKWEGHVGLPVLGRLQDEVVERLADLRVLAVVGVGKVVCEKESKRLRNKQG